MTSHAAGFPAEPFGTFDVRLDPWAADYGAETPADFAPEIEPVDVDMDVERPGGAWQPIVPVPSPGPGELLFVDGVRRIDTRLVVQGGARTLHGAFGSYGVGAVRVREGRASFGEEIVGRVVIFGSGEVPPAPVVVSRDLVYQPRSVAETDPDAPVRALHREMRGVEETFARRLADAAAALVVADGPLNFGEATPGRVVGFVKRLFQLYLPSARQGLLRELPPGTRTPLFLIRGAGRFARYAWFVRLGPRLPIESAFTGLVRLEVTEAVGAIEAARLADLTAARLPPFVPSRTRDPRAPQNLVPIGALEQHLRHAMGDARLIRRRIATLLAGAIVHA